jgi:hypothetical protein
MKLVIATQDRENYGAHDWDGKGVCPQYWKFKGGREYMVEGIPGGVDLEEVVELVAATSSRTTIISIHRLSVSS